MLEQILEGQQDIIVDFKGKIDALYTDLNGKFEALDSHVKKLDIRISQSASSSRGSDTKQHQPCHVVDLSSGIQLEPVLKKGLSSEDIIDLEEVEDDVILRRFCPRQLMRNHSVGRHGQ